jgi:hypothetical protein
MLKNISKLEIQVGEKMYHFYCDHDSPIEHVKEALFQFQKYVGQIEDAVKANTSQAMASNEEIKEEAKPIEAN